VKIHTIRKGNRWRPGLSIEHAHGVRTKSYDCFKKGKCHGTERIRIWFEKGNIEVMVEASMLTLSEKMELARNDGFDDYSDFVRWFRIATEDGTDIFGGQIIHWTPKRYA
jgi:hypothetical protein